MSSLRNSYAVISNQPKRPSFLNCTLNDDKTTINSNQDYSAVEGRFYFECPADDQFIVEHFDMHISGATNLKSEDYADITNGLINGLDWYALIDGVEQIITPIPPIKTNEDLFRLGHHHQNIPYAGGVSTHSYAGHLHEFSDGFILNPGDQIGVILRDDFSSLSRQEFYLLANSYQGISRPQS